MTESEQIQKIIENALRDRGVESKDGLRGPTCQTGEEYIEFVIRSSTNDSPVTLAIAAAGLVCGFAKKGATCYWRIKADYEAETVTRNPGVYVRFFISSKPELPQSEAA